MFKRLMMVIGVLVIIMAFGVAQAQDTLRVLAIDYLGGALESTGLAGEVELTVATQPELEAILAEGRVGEFDVVLADNLVIDPFQATLGQDIFIPLCERNPELCPLPDVVLDICAIRPWLPMCSPCPVSPWSLSCDPTIVWDRLIIVDPWDPMPWTVDGLIEVINNETVMVDPRNGTGFYLEPAVFDLARPNLTINMEEAFLVFTPVCNYVARYEEFNAGGFVPITVEGYEETTFNVSPYVVSSGNVDLATEFAGRLLTDAELQVSLFRETGLLPGNVDALTQVLPG